MEESQQQIEEVSAQKGGLRTIPFIIVNESFEKIASYGLVQNMILYLTNGYHMESATGSALISLWVSLSDFLSILGAFISDSYLGRFRVIALGSISSLVGMILLWLTAMVPQAKPPPCSSVCQSPTFPQLALLISSFGFISIGAGCVRPCSIAFGADQLVETDNLEKNKRVLDSYFTWYYASFGLSVLIALTAVVYIQDHFGMKVGLGLPALLMLLSASSFLVGSSRYVQVKPQESLFTGFAQVLVAAFKKRHLVFPSGNSDGLCYHSKDCNFVAPSDKLRFLNKGCVIKNHEEDLNYDGSAANPWELCTVDQVEGLKALISVIPIWSTGIMIFSTLSTGSLAVLQANSMDRHITSNFQIPAASFPLFASLTSTIWLAFYNQVVIPLLAKCTGRQHGISPTVRMGIGVIISSIAMSVAAVVEDIRRRIAIQEGLLDDPTGVVNMSAMWLILQYSLIGLAEGFNAVGQIEYYYSHLPKSMSSMAMALFTLGSAFGGLVGSLMVTIVNKVTESGGMVSWLSTNLNKAKMAQTSIKKQVRFTDKMDQVMIKALYEECLAGGKADNGWKSETLRRVATLVQVHSLNDYEIEPKHIRSRLKTLKKDWELAKECINKSGFQYNVVSNTVSADDISWEAYIKEKPTAAALRTKITPYYVELTLICGKDQATGARCVGDGYECGSREGESQNPFIDIVDDFDSPTINLEVVDPPFSTFDEGTKYTSQPESTSSKKQIPVRKVTPLGKRPRSRLSSKEDIEVCEAMKTMAEASKTMAGAMDKMAASYDEAIDFVILEAALNAIPDLEEDHLLAAMGIFASDKPLAAMFMKLSEARRGPWIRLKLGVPHPTANK